MLKQISLAVLGCFLSSNALAGAKFELNSIAGEIVMKAQMVYYGENVDPAMAAKATDEIQGLWSGQSFRPGEASHPLKVKVGAGNYALRAEVTYVIVTLAEAQALANTNTDPSVNFIRFRKGGMPGDRSYYHSLGANSGVFYETDGIGTSTTTAHEFGHGLGLDHPSNFDWRKLGRPAIMCPRGTIVEAQYQWNPKAQAGASGGTMNPIWRLVSQWDVDNVGIDKLTFDASGNAWVGYATNDIETSPVSFSIEYFRAFYEGLFFEPGFLNP
ncbi:MAG: hypothetical protein JNL01_03000 [Bdellovibrionales bacterium]|nr:hypothetical protein [Bdellovibrionales bacterium]